MRTLPNDTRITFLDNIRVLMVFCVVVVHSAAAYTNSISWWYVRDSQTSTLFDVVAFLLDIFQMPVLFFIAGYFAFPSLYKRGSAGFLMSKLKRLGIPLVLIGIFLVPVMPYIRYRGRTNGGISFFDYWVNQMKSIFSLALEHASSNAEIEGHLDDFIQHHLWFISLLLLFFLGFVISVKLSSMFGHTSPQTKNDDHIPNHTPPAVSMGITGLVVAISFGVVNLFSKDGSWAKIGGLLLFQPTRTMIYVGMFALGAYAYQQKWFILQKFPGPWWLWLTGSLVSTLLFLASVETIYTRPLTLTLSMFHGFLRTLLCLTYTGFFASLGVLHWNKLTRINKGLANSSYSIYLIHLPIVVIMQLLFLSLNIPIFLKFSLIAVSTICLCWWLSKTLILLYPKIAIMLLLSAFMIVSLVA